MTESTQEELAALTAAARDLLEDHCTPERLAASEGRTDLALWALLAEAGFTHVGIAEDAGGSGGGIVEAAALLGVAGEHAAPVPLAESTLLAGWLLALAGLPQPDGLATTGEGEVSARPVDGGYRLQGTVRRVPAARDAELVVVLARVDGDGAARLVVAAVPVAGTSLVEGHNVAGEQRDDVLLDLVVPDVVEVRAGTADELRLRGALSRSVLIAGALDRVLRLTVRYAGERRQFGRPLSAFQAVQQQVALLAAEAAAAHAAADGAVEQCARDGFATPASAFAVAAAKVRTAQAASTAAAIAHQVHGALGMTREHSLRFSTTRLWAWRSEWGSEAQWSQQLGRTAVAAGADGVWPLLVGA
ncbi:MAG: acyl-CoA dehydrogenase [Frankiales bacterium]|jgi:acyl-CoA dehydrogenase|nr:acyl-CoA dehydrogenase [Frankiales bacterium]